ncbi:hypothetical protein BC829DRAFT_57504 [Chytridium lagenaria]|nr:hypothetical protein BC829DRAFT_57504 [Chytridium lagenaria]
MQEVEEFLEMHSLTSDEGRKKKKKKQDVPVSELSEEDQLRLALAASMGSEAVEIQEAELTVEAKDPTLLIKGNVRDEPLAGDTTRLQFRMPDGSRQVRKFLKSDKVLYLFEFVKGVCAEVASKPFELLNFRDALSSKMEESLESAKVLNASINIELKE